MYTFTDVAYTWASLSALTHRFPTICPSEYMTQFVAQCRKAAPVNRHSTGDQYYPEMSGILNHIKIQTNVDTWSYFLLLQPTINWGKYIHPNKKSKQLIQLPILHFVCVCVVGMNGLQENGFIYEWHYGGFHPRKSDARMQYALGHFRDASWTNLLKSPWRANHANKNTSRFMGLRSRLGLGARFKLKMMWGPKKKWPEMKKPHCSKSVRHQLSSIAKQ